MKVQIKLALIGIALAALLVGSSAALEHVRDQGREEVRDAWDADKLTKTQAENAAILTRVKNNERIAEQQAINNLKILKGHQNEVASIHAAYASPYSLRIPASICSGFAAGAKTQSPSGSDATITGTIALPETVNRNLQDLTLEADTVVAGCRAAQEFIIANGFSP